MPHPVHLSLDSCERRLSLCLRPPQQWFQWPSRPTPYIPGVPQLSFPSEHCQYYLMVCMKTCLPQPCFGEALPICAKNLVPPPRHMSTLLPHLPHPASHPSVPSPQNEVGFQINQPNVRQCRCKIFLPGVLRFPQSCVEVSQQDYLHSLWGCLQGLFRVMDSWRIVWGNVRPGNIPSP